MIFYVNALRMYFQFCQDSCFFCLDWRIYKRQHEYINLIEITAYANKINSLSCGPLSWVAFSSGFIKAVLIVAKSLFPLFLKQSCGGLQMTSFFRPFFPFSPSPIACCWLHQKMRSWIGRNQPSIFPMLQMHFNLVVILNKILHKFDRKRFPHYIMNESLTDLLQLNLGLPRVHELAAPKSWTLISSRFR